MKIDIALILKKALLESGKVVLPGFGTFILEISSASYKKNENKILPPKSTIIFLNSTLDDGYMIKYLSAYYKISAQSAEDLLDHFVGNLNDSLLSGTGLTRVAYLGTFKRVNDQIHFNEDERLSTWYTKDLLPVIPIPISNLTHQSLNSDLKFRNPYSTSETNQSKMIRWLPFMIIAVLLVFAAKFYLDRKNMKFQPMEETNIESITDTAFDYTGISDSIIEVPIEEVDLKECIIITGYFTVAKNVLKMSEKIEGMGYKLYLEEIADGTRVGFKFNCTDTDLKEKIYEIRSTISKESWYLVPPITIE